MFKGVVTQIISLNVTEVKVECQNQDLRVCTVLNKVICMTRYKMQKLFPLYFRDTRPLKTTAHVLIIYYDKCGH